jgi:hypothetical protein
MTDVIAALSEGKRLRQERLDRLIKTAEDMQRKNWLGIPQITDLASKLRGLHVQACELPTEDDRKGHAKAIEAAKQQAANTLAALGL